jgi:uncharacterized protein
MIASRPSATHQGPGVPVPRPSQTSKEGPDPDAGLVEAPRGTQSTTGPPPQLRLPRLRSVVARHPVGAFVVLACLIGTVLPIASVVTGPVLLFGIGTVYGPLVNIVGSAVPALLVTAMVSGRVGVRDLVRRSLRWRVPLRWYAIALLAPPAIFLATVTALYGLAPLGALAENWPLLLTSFLPTLAVMVVVNNVAEEVGWTGFLFPRLQNRHGPLRAAMLTGLFFWLHHIPGFVVDTGSWLMAVVITGIAVLPHLASRVVIGWLYNAAGASVLIGGLLHAMHNALVNPTGFGVAVLGLPQGEVLVVVSGLFVLAGVLVAVVTRGRLGLPRGNPSDPSLDPSAQQLRPVL